MEKIFGKINVIMYANRENGIEFGKQVEVEVTPSERGIALTFNIANDLFPKGTVSVDLNIKEIKKILKIIREELKFIERKGD